MIGKSKLTAIASEHKVHIGAELHDKTAMAHEVDQLYFVNDTNLSNLYCMCAHNGQKVHNLWIIFYGRIVSHHTQIY